LAVLGAIGGGLLADRLVRRGVSPVNSRKVPLVAGLVGVAVFTICAAEVSSNAMAVACVTLAMVCGAMCSGLYWALASAIAPSNCTASAGSLANFGSYIGGAITPAVTGVIVQVTGSFTPALLLGGAIALISALSYLVLIKNESMDFSQLNVKAAPRPAVG
jgi:nitrate/nitrite transporter NarK